MKLLNRQICGLLLLLSFYGCESDKIASQAASDASTSQQAGQIWVSAWADAPDGLAGPASSEQTFRELVKPTVGSRGAVRLHFSNYFGSSPVTIGAVHVGVQSVGAALSSDVAVTFGGSGSVTIPPNGFATSDQIPLTFAYGEVLAVTEYVSGSWNGLTQHIQAGSNVTSYMTPANAGNATGDLSGKSFALTTFETYLVDRVDVFGDYKGTIAAFGSSTTDGINSGLDLHQTYPEQLAAALHKAGRDDVAIANVGISGDQLLGSSSISGLSRFSRDVIPLPGVSAVIDYLGANDLRAACVAATALINGQQTLISQAHTAGLKIYLATTAPSTFCGAQNPNGFGSRFAQGSGEDAQRFLINQWDTSTTQSQLGGTVEQPPGADSVIDFSGALSDPSNLSYMLPSLDSGDDIHPNAAGYAAMVRAIPLSLF